MLLIWLRFCPFLGFIFEGDRFISIYFMGFSPPFISCKCQDVAIGLKAAFSVAVALLQPFSSAVQHWSNWGKRPDQQFLDTSETVVTQAQIVREGGLERWLHLWPILFRMVCQSKHEILSKLNSIFCSHFFALNLMQEEQGKMFMNLFLFLAPFFKPMFE